MTLIDTHCHLDFDAYDEIRADVVAEAADMGVTRIIIPATSLDSARDALRLADAFPGVYAAVGIHPNSAASYSPADLDVLRELAAHPKVVAIGEIGLDYYRDSTPPDQQRRALEGFLTLAASLRLPVILHNRESDADLLAMLSGWVRDLPPALAGRPGVLHSFSAPSEVADRALELGFYLGFTGPITYKKADTLRQIAARVPGDRILVETDGPFLTPEPRRGRFPNHPGYVRWVAERIAALRNVPDETFFAQSTANAERLFGLPPMSAASPESS